MLYKISTDDAEFTFVDRIENRRLRNVFTVIVGKNGTGKSRLFRAIAMDFLLPKGNVKKFGDITKYESNRSNVNAYWLDEVSKLICVSTSPFDKFPILKRNSIIPYYSYLGLRGLSTTNMGLAYLSRIIYTLAHAAASNSNHSRAIGEILDYLDYEPIMKVTLSISSPSFLIDLINSINPREAIEIFSSRGSMFAGEYLTAMSQLVTADSRTFQKFMSAARRLADWPKRQKIEMYLTGDGLAISLDYIISPEDVVLLGRFGMLKLRDVELRKKATDAPVMISEMSSGEQTVVMGLLGIGSQIEDGALICIDEPEVCLHPEWQERYIQLLSQVFSHYKKCHFIIATHSPQIVAQLPPKGCYVMQMEDGVAHPAMEFSKRSIDFQLATVFKSPGYKNEYLSRLALSTFIEVANEKLFSEENLKNLNILILAIPQISQDDPLLEIIKSVQEMYNTYG